MTSPVRVLAVALLTLLVSVQLFAADTQPTLINGTEVPPGEYPEVVQVSMSLTSTSIIPCTGTIVGPRALLTAAHCVSKPGGKVKVKVGERTVFGQPVLSPYFRTNDHDVAVIFVEEPFDGIKPAVIGGKATVGTGLKLLGYGCNRAENGNRPEGVLRIGETVIVGMANYDMVSKRANGGVVCNGDDGGPAYATESGKQVLLGINSKSDLVASNWSARLDIQQSRDFLKQAADTQATTICGINSDCTDPTPLPPDKKASCTLTASPNTVKLSDQLTLSIISQNAVKATIEGQSVNIPTGQLVITAEAEGNFTARAEAIADSGQVGVCSATYVVEQRDTPLPPQDRPTCTLTATPTSVKPGQVVTFELIGQGAVNYASIDSKAVAFPVGKAMLTAKSKGDFSVTGFVRGPAGSSNCFADYRVSDDGGIAPEIPPYTVIPVYCGENELLDTRVYKVCLGVVRKDDAAPDLRLNQALFVTYSDSTKEVLPIIARVTRPAQEGETYVKEDMVLYANNSVAGPDYTVLDTRAATLTKLPPATPSSGAVPVEIEGRTATGKYFLVKQLSAQMSRIAK